MLGAENRPPRGVDCGPRHRGSARVPAARTQRRPRPMTHLLLGDAVASNAAFMASEGGVKLDFDLSFLVQMAAFAVLIVVLKPLLFEPLLRLFEERERRTDGARVLARKMDAEAGEMLQKYEAELEKVRRAAAEERERTRAEATRLEAKILAEAREESAKIIDEGRARIAAEAAATRAALATEARHIAAAIAGRVLGREVR